MPKADIYVGNVLKRLSEIPEKSVRTCITSPPYFGLRDYGTGEWEGGDPDCSHQRDNKRGKSTETGHSNPLLTVGDAIYKSVCPKCGAVREDEQIGLEETPEEYVEAMVAVFREVKRVLTDDGTVWLNIGDSYSGSGKGAKADGTATGSEKQASNKGTQVGHFTKTEVEGLKAKDLIGIPWMLAFALRADGWYLRQDIIWAKPNPMPESVTDRCTKSHEYIFLLSKSPRYYYDHEAIKEQGVMSSAGSNQRDTRETHGVGGGNAGINAAKERMKQELAENGYVMRNKRDVWTVNAKGFKGAHFAVMPEALVEPSVLAGSAEGDTVLDPFTGSGTVAVVALRHGRNFVGTELNPEYAEIANKRITESAPMFNQVTVL